MARQEEGDGHCTVVYLQGKGKRQLKEKLPARRPHSPKAKSARPHYGKERSKEKGTGRNIKKRFRSGGGLDRGISSTCNHAAGPAQRPTRIKKKTEGGGKEKKNGGGTGQGEDESQ